MSSHRNESIESPRERAILVGAPTRDVSALDAQEHLLELARLTDTAGATVVGSISQWLDAPHPKYYIGEGKARELKALAAETEAELVVFDEELSPAQAKNLENLLQLRVLDRAELILDIFATRARTREAQMQVELAQLQYMLPRLKRMWTHLERTRGGIGMRGPGEMQLETDRRLIGRRIRDLRQKLEVVARRRETRRKGREGEFRVALVGYTNAGKSSILRSLSGADLFVEDRLFATLDATTRAVTIASGDEGARDRHRRLHPQAAARARRLLPRDARGDGRGRRAPARHRCLAPGVGGAQGGRRLRARRAGPRRSADRPGLQQGRPADARGGVAPARARGAAFDQPSIFTSTLEDGGLAVAPRTAGHGAPRPARRRSRCASPSSTARLWPRSTERARSCAAKTRR